MLPEIGEMNEMPTRWSSSPQSLAAKRKNRAAAATAPAGDPGVAGTGRDGEGAGGCFERPPSRSRARSRAACRAMRRRERRRNDKPAAVKAGRANPRHVAVARAERWRPGNCGRLLTVVLAKEYAPRCRSCGAYVSRIYRRPATVSLQLRDYRRIRPPRGRHHGRRRQAGADGDLRQQGQFHLGHARACRQAQADGQGPRPKCLPCCSGGWSPICASARTARDWHRESAPRHRNAWLPPEGVQVGLWYRRFAAVSRAARSGGLLRRMDAATSTASATTC